MLEFGAPRDSGGRIIRIYLILGTAIWCGVACGQSVSSGVVTGLVTDQNNGAVRGAIVQLSDKATRETRSTATNEAGRYTIYLAPGVYDVSMSRTGFSVYHL